MALGPIRAAGLPDEATLVLSQLVLNLAGHAGRSRAMQLLGAFLDAADMKESR